MNKYWEVLISVFLMLATLAIAQDEVPKKQNGSSGSGAAQQQTSSASAEGEKEFRTHCGRCHTPPQQLSPKATGTIVHHMQVRAMLSEKDTRKILEYLAP